VSYIFEEKKDKSHDFHTDSHHGARMHIINNTPQFTEAPFLCDACGS